MKKLFFTIFLLLVIAPQLQGQARIALTGGYETGLMNTGRIGKGYEQNTKSTRYMADLAWRYNGANHLVVEGGYRYDSCAFVNNAEYLAPNENEFFQYNSRGMIKMKSALLGVAYRLALYGNTFGVSLQSGLSGQYIYQASRYSLPDEKFKYRLYDEIAPFNLLLRTKIGLRLSIFHILVGYEHPFYDSLNHQQITSSLPGDEKNRSADLRGLRFDADAFFVSFAVKISFGEAYKTFNKLATGEKGN
ncbi:MAG: hypothetical protein ACQEQ0_02590 [Bacteroidota bacterium]